MASSRERKFIVENVSKVAEHAIRLVTERIMSCIHQTISDSLSFALDNLHSQIQIYILLNIQRNRRLYN